MKPGASVDVGAPTSDGECDAYAAQVAQAFAARPTDMRRWLDQAGPDGVRVARVGGEVMGGYVCYRVGQFFGGRALAMGGVAGVAVAAHARGGGVATALMRHVLAELREAAIPISTLYPATRPLYRRLGWEVSGTRTIYRLGLDSIDHGGAGDRRWRAATVRAAGDGDDALLAELADRRGALGSGQLVRSPALWQRVFGPAERPAHRYVIETDGRPSGYLVYTPRDRPGERHLLDVHDHVALDAPAARRLLGLFADHRSVAGEARVRGAPCEPLFAHLSDPRVRVEEHATWMTRLVDVAAALAGRGWPAIDADLELDVADDVRADNAGRWRLRLERGVARVERGGAGRIAIDVRGLAALYGSALGAAAVAQLGYVDADPDACAALDRVFAGPPAWLTDFF